jgi:hypothetical protein
MSDQVKKSWPELIGFRAAIMEIKAGLPPHRPTLARALRGDKPIPDVVRKFLADLVEGKLAPENRRKEGRQEANLLERELKFAILRGFYESHYMRLKAIPKAKRKFHGSPSDAALIRTAEDVAKLGIGISGPNGKALSPRAISDRLKLKESKSSKVV